MELFGFDLLFGLHLLCVQTSHQAWILCKYDHQGIAVVNIINGNIIFPRSEFTHAIERGVLHTDTLKFLVVPVDSNVFRPSLIGRLNDFAYQRIGFEWCAIHAEKRRADDEPLSRLHVQPHLDDNLSILLKVAFKLAGHNQLPSNCFVRRTGF